MAGQPQQFPREGISPPLRGPREHSNAHRGHKEERIRRLHAGEGGVRRAEREVGEREELLKG